MNAEAVSSQSSDDSEDDSPTVTLPQNTLSVPGATKVTASPIPGGNGSTVLIDFKDGTGAYAFIGSVVPSNAALTTLASAIVKAHG